MAGKIIGEIFSKDKANEEFCDVQKSVEVKTDTLENLLARAQEYVMFNIETNDFKMLAEGRVSIRGKVDSDNEVFYRVSISKINELLELGKNGTTYIEMRPKTLTITHGSYTLEKTLPCPPFCG